MAKLDTRQATVQSRRPMRDAIRDVLNQLNRLARERTLGRSIVLALAIALGALLLANLSTFVLVQRTAQFNESVDAQWQARRSGRLLLLNLKDAETAHRGYLLTGQSDFLLSYRGALAAHASLLEQFRARISTTPEGQGDAEVVTRLSRDKIIEMERTLELFRQGRANDAIAVVRQGRGRLLMRELDAALGDVDQRIGGELAEATARSEGSAAFTSVVNALAGLLILVLAGIVFLMVRRYLDDVQAKQAELDRVNAGLEETIRNRTAALTRANEEVQRFAYIVSHDLRSPLVNVMGYTAELDQAGRTLEGALSSAEVERAVDPAVVTAIREDIPEAIGFIRASTEKMDRLINAILKLSREGRRTLVPEMLDVTTMVRRIADSVAHQLDEARAELIVGDLPEMENDRLSIEQIMGNLIDNAVKYLDPKRPGRIEVRGRDVPGGWVEYEIADNGRGISEKDHERIFELFRRSGRQDRPGEGLGLAFVRNSVRRLGGDITVESTLGEGSTFRLKFPKRLILDEVGETL
jgi:signal transduction histidine kinase